jgi:hypothetical protein
MPIAWNTNQVAFTVSEPLHTPALSLILGYGATLPFIAGAAGAALIHDTAIAQLCLDLIVLWGAAILLFLAGVRRGLSFRTPNGPTAGQIAASMWYFTAGFGSLLLWALEDTLGSEAPALLLLLAGYASLIVFDVRAARHLEAPPYFARLRPVQMLIPIASLGFMLILFKG